jgi:hypothetical protein
LFEQHYLCVRLHRLELHQPSLSKVFSFARRLNRLFYVGAVACLLDSRSASKGEQSHEKMKRYHSDSWCQQRHKGYRIFKACERAWEIVTVSCYEV